MIEHFVTLIAALAKQANKAVENGRAQAQWALAAKLEGLRFESGGIGGASSRMNGKIDGRSVRVDTYKMQRKEAEPQVWTRYKIDVDGDLPRGLRIEPVAPLAGLFQPAVGSPQVASGDEAFDRHIRIFSDDPAAVAAWLTDDRLVRIRKAFNTHRGVRLSESGVRFDRRDFDDKASRIQSTLHELVGLAQVLGDQSSPVLHDERGSAWDALLTGGAAALSGEQEPEQELELEQEPEAEPVLELDEEPEPEPIEEFVPEKPSVAEDVPEPATESPPISDEPEEAAADSAPAEDAVAHSDLSALEVAGELFEPGRTGFETTRIFDEEFAGQVVRWTGTLERIEKYSSDLVFGAGPGVKARLELCELPGEGYGRDVHASVMLPAALEEELRAQRGAQLVVSGKLIKCDPFLRTLFLADGAVGDR